MVLRSYTASSNNSTRQGALPSQLADAAGLMSTIGAHEPLLPPNPDRRIFAKDVFDGLPGLWQGFTGFAQSIARADWRGWSARNLQRASNGWRLALRSAHRLRLKPVLAVSLAALLLSAGYFVYCIATLPIGGGLSVEATPSALLVEANDGQVFATRGVFKGERLLPADLPANLSRAVVAIEDRRFYEHGGIDPRAIMRAAWRNLSGEKIEGASTITQQLARMLYLSPERTFKRKVQEAMLAVWLELQLSKEEILARYLTTAYFGAGVYGIDAAAKRYFGKPAKDLSLSESAMLAGLVRAPSALAPHRNLERARERAGRVLAAMVESGTISREEAEAARRQPAEVRVPPETPTGTNYFVDMVNNDARRLVGAGPADLRLASTLDLKLQSMAESVIAKRLAAEGSAKKVSQAALVAMAHDGAILAMVGGRDYNESQFNRAIQAKRQPGSLFKTFVYLAALQKGFTPQSTLVDRPVQIGEWEPENYGGRYRGQVTLRVAFANSLNSIAVQLSEAVGVPRVIEVAKKLGVQSDLPAVPSLALGSAEVSLLEMTRAFAAIAANVDNVEPYGVRAIRRGDQALYTKPAVTLRPAADQAARADMRDLLASTVREGTGKAARLPVPVAGKTGTTQEHRDAWFIGFTSDFVVGVWIGNDDNSPTNGVTGGSLPATIWREFVTQAGPARANSAVAAAARKPAAAAPAPAETLGRNPPHTVAANAVAVRGVPRVLDTGTLEIQGKVIRLFGVEGMSDHRMKRGLARFIDDEEVVCEATDADGTHRCRLDDKDLSAIILINGGGRASAEATPELRAAEERAREARLGLWRRR
jgi:1A family penicillin-binding protein